MTFASYTKFLSDTFKRQFPEYSIKISKDSDDSRCLFVTIYGVPKELVDEIESKAHDIIDAKILPKSRDFMSIPDVVDRETTQRYYSHLMPLPEVPKIRIHHGKWVTMRSDDEQPCEYPTRPKYRKHSITSQQKVEHECQSKYAA